MFILKSQILKANFLVKQFLFITSSLLSIQTLALQCDYNVSNNWGDGFTASITIINDGPNTINDWQVEWRHNSASTISNLWNAVSSGNNPYVASNTNWNNTISPGNSTGFGFLADGTDSAAVILSCASSSENSSSSGSSTSSSSSSSTSSSSTSSSSSSSSSSASSSSSSSSGSGSCELPYLNNGLSISQETRSWRSGVIDISCASSVNISMLASGTGPMESADFLDIYYTLDDEEQIAISQITNAFVEKTVSVSNLSGSTLEIVIEGATSYFDETYTVSSININAPGGSSSSTSSSSSSSSASSSSGGQADQDVFGIAHLYPSPANEQSWNGLHWQAANYTISQRIDSNDPQGLSGKRGTGELAIVNGEMVFGGSQPRLYVYPYSDFSWQNVEATAYYKRVSDDGTAWGGMVIGMRSGPEGHASETCDAHTYYARMRHDGATDFAKELHHSSSQSAARIEPEILWPGQNGLPFNQWIGFKFVIYNLADGTVQLESYRDLSGGANGGNWQLINSLVDNGNWSTPSSCAEHNPVNGSSNMIWTGGGVTFIRNTGVNESRYRWVSVREIDSQ